jgi:hypothetical protein
VAGGDLLAEAAKAGRGFGMFDRVNGADATRRALQPGAPAAEIVACWKPGDEAFRRRRKKHLPYERACVWTVGISRARRLSPLAN